MMIYNNYNVVQNIYDERCAAGERAARFFVCSLIANAKKKKKRKLKIKIKETRRRNKDK